MSNEVSIYSGPYFRFKVDKIASEKLHQLPCRCGRQSPGPTAIFCPHCGKKLEWLTGKVLVPDVKYEDIQLHLMKCDLGEEDLIDLSEDSSNIILIPNENKHNIGEYWSGYSGLAGIMMTEPNIEAEKAELANLYSRHLQALKELRGPERVTIEWGVVVTEN